VGPTFRLLLGSRRYRSLAVGFNRAVFSSFSSSTPDALFRVRSCWLFSLLFTPKCFSFFSFGFFTNSACRWLLCFQARGLSSAWVSHDSSTLVPMCFCSAFVAPQVGHQGPHFRFIILPSFSQNVFHSSCFLLLRSLVFHLDVRIEVSRQATPPQRWLILFS